MLSKTNNHIPVNICLAATELLRPYVRDLTPEKLTSAITFKREEQNDRLLSRRETSLALHISLPTLDRMLRAGELSRIHVRGRVFIRKSEVDRIINGEG